MSLLFRGISAGEYGPLLAASLESAVSIRDAVIVVHGQINEHNHHLFWEAYETSQREVMRLQEYHRRLDANKPGGRLPRALHQFASRYVDAIARRTDSANNMMAAAFEGPERDIARYRKQAGVLDEAVQMQAYLLANFIDKLLTDEPQTAAQLRLTPQLSRQIRASAEAHWALGEMPT